MYTDGSGIKGKIDIITIISSQNAAFITYLAFAHLFMIYFGKLQEITLVLNNFTLVRN